MSTTETAKWQAMGYRAKRHAGVLHPDLKDWEMFKRTFGFYQWKTKNKATDEQLSAFEEGFKHEK